MIIEALKSSGKISQGIGLINKLADVVTRVLIQPDEISKSSELLASIKNTLSTSKQWLSDVEEHLKFIEQTNEDSNSTALS